MSKDDRVQQSTNRRDNWCTLARFISFLAAWQHTTISSSRLQQDPSMEYLPTDLSPRERYKILTSFVLPRPIAWVTTMGETGVVNAAPFSFFNVLGEDPPLCVFAINLRPDGRTKDTLINIQRMGEFVVHITDEPLAQAMHETGGDFPPDVSEPDHLGLKLAPSSTIAVPRLADAPIAMECKTWK